MSEYSKESHSKVRRIPDRAHYDEETIHDIIDSAPICHVSFIQEGRPFVIPCIHGRARRTIYLHGAKASRLLGETGSGRNLCLAFTNLDDDSSSSSAGGGFIITAPDNATTSEGGDNASFTVKLNMAPTSPVTIPVYVSDNTEALLTSGSYSNVDNLTLTFDTSSNLWSTPQTITVTGQGPDSDYETGYSVILMPASSSDINYNGANPQDIEFVNIEWNVLYLYNAGTTNANMGGKLGADATCNAHSNKPTGTSGYAFTSFDSPESLS